MGTNPNWPDRNGSAGGMGPDGYAARHSEAYLDVPVQVFGSTPAGAVAAGPRGGGWTPLPRNTPKTGPYTTGQQRSKR
jgi:hypothetical protein